MSEFPQLDSGLVVLVFNQGDDPIACLNKAMAFMPVIAASRFPSTNNQLRTSSNLRNQATIQHGRITMQQVQRRQVQSYAGEGHVARQCTQPKRPRNVAWFKEKEMLAKAHKSGQILDEEQLAFLVDLGISDCHDVQPTIIHNAAFQTNDLDAYDSDCNDISSAKAVLMASLSNYGLDVLSEVQNFEINQNDMDNQNVQAMQHFEQTHVDDSPDNEITKQAFWLQTLHPNTDQSDISPIKIEDPRELPKVRLVNTILKKIKYHLGKFDTVVKKRTTPDAITEGSWGFEHTKTVFLNEVIPFFKTLKDIFNVFDKDLLDEITKVLTVFNQMEATAQQCSIDKQYFRIHKKELFLDNDRLLLQIMSQDVMLMFKLDLDPLAPRLLKNRDVHIDYLNYTQEQADILQGIVEQAKAKQPLDNALDFACKHAKRIPELLVYVKDTCPNATKPSEKLVAVTPINKVKKVRFADPVTSLNNTQKQVGSHKTQDSNQPLLHSTGVICSTSTSGSKPTGNTKNNRISQSSSSNKTNKIEDQSRSVKSRKNKKNRVAKTECNASDVPSSSSLVDFRFGNDQIEKIMDYGDYQLGNVTISRVYYLEGLAHNLFFVGQFCDSDLEVKFLRSKDEVPEFVIKFLKMIQARLNATVRNIRTDNGTEFFNRTLKAYYENVRITHQKSVARTPQQKGVVERRNRTLVEATRTMLIFSKALLFLWAEAVATACYTQNRYLI
ncbi:retrovirus-related pol polyprotein from transposon TNT 1-94 [Tanacetum coccineum]